MQSVAIHLFLSSVYTMSALIRTALGNIHNLAFRVHCLLSFYILPKVAASNLNGNITTLNYIENSFSSVWQCLACFKQCSWWHVFSSGFVDVCTQNCNAWKPEKLKNSIYLVVLPRVHRSNAALELPDSTNNQQSSSLITALPMVMSKLLSHSRSDECS